MRYLVVKKAGAKSAQQFKIVAPVITIGRTSENSIALKDSSVSRQHCVIETSNNVTRIRDVGSFHGFMLNNKQTREAILKHGDRVMIGSYELYYVIVEDSKQEPSEGDKDNKAGNNGNASADSDGLPEMDSPPEKDHAPLTVDDDDIPPLTVDDDDDEPMGMDSEPESRLTGEKHFTLEPDRTDGEAQPLGLESEHGEMSIDDGGMELGLETDSGPATNSDMDLNALIGGNSKSKPEAEAPPPAPSPKVDAPPPTRAQPRAQAAPPVPKIDPKLVEAQGAIKQLQREFGELLKAFEANKSQLKKTIEGYEAEKLKSLTIGKKYKRAVEKLTGLEAQSTEAVSKITALEDEATQSHREYNELDEKLHASELDRESAIVRAEKFEMDIIKISRTRDDLQQQAGALQKEKDELEADLSKFQSQHSTARKKIATLETNLNTVQESRMRAKSVAATLEQERNELQKKLTVATKERAEYKDRAHKLEELLKESLHAQTSAETKIVQVQKDRLGSNEQLTRLQEELNEATDRAADMEEDLEDAREEVKLLRKTAPGNVAPGSVPAGVIDEAKVKRKLLEMEKQRRKAVAIAERAQQQLNAAHQQAVVLQSFLDEREVLIKKLREKLKTIGVEETQSE